MAAKTEHPTAEHPKRVPITPPHPRGNEDPNLFLAVNGKICIVPKGQTSMVLPEFAAEYERSVAAANKQHMNARAMEERARQEAVKPW